MKKQIFAFLILNVLILGCVSEDVSLLDNTNKDTAKKIITTCSASDGKLIYVDSYFDNGTFSIRLQNGTGQTISLIGFAFDDDFSGIMVPSTEVPFSAVSGEEFNISGTTEELSDVFSKGTLNIMYSYDNGTTEQVSTWQCEGKIEIPKEEKQDDKKQDDATEKITVKNIFKDGEFYLKLSDVVEDGFITKIDVNKMEADELIGYMSVYEKPNNIEFLLWVSKIYPENMSLEKVYEQYNIEIAQVTSDTSWMKKIEAEIVGEASTLWKGNSFERLDEMFKGQAPVMYQGVYENEGNYDLYFLIFKERRIIAVLTYKVNAGSKPVSIIPKMKKYADKVIERMPQ